MGGYFSKVEVSKMTPKVSTSPRRRYGKSIFKIKVLEKVTKGGPDVFGEENFFKCKA